MWPSFWCHFGATLPLEMRTVGLVLFLQAFALLSVLCCLPAVRPSDQVFSPAGCHNCPASVQCQWIIRHPYHTTPTTSHRRYTRQDLLDIGAASSSSADLLSPLLITHLRHLGFACTQPRKPRRSRRGGRNELQKINVRVDGSEGPIHRPPVDFISTQPDRQHHSSHPDTTTASH